MANAKKELEINEGIRDREVRVIDADGSQLGVMSARDALRKAEERNLDLVKIAPQATPPVCKILDYGKYRFEMQKKDKEARKNQRVVDIKEIRLSLNIDTNDFNTKVNHAAKFLKNGDKVKVTIRFRGREMAHTELGLEVHKRFAAALPQAVVEKQPKLEGRSMIMFLNAAPNKNQGGNSNA
ncbi:MAG TPA: translation initiation factor IF-3 [Candidatus Anaerofilum excrementigallinarum]|nr:translation initiation factor IF-3 [Candidatus Anaerofilum excrementigallinarum]